MITKIQVMKFIYNNYQLTKDLSLSKRQVELISHLKHRQATSRDIANRYCICVQNASQQLNNLYRKGYLERLEIEDKTGGYMFEYTSNPKLFKGEEK